LIIFPIFDRNPLITRKYFDYLCIKEAWYILENQTLSIINRNYKMESIYTKLKQGPYQDYKSPVWAKINLSNLNLTQANLILSKPWIIGFWEAKGSFYIVKKDENRLVHGFALSQKEDQLILEALRLILSIIAKVKDQKTFYLLDSTNFRSILNVINFFYNKNTGQNLFKSRKSLEFSIWRRSIKFKNNFQSLLKTQALLHKIRGHN